MTNHADGIPTDTLAVVLENVAEDPDLTPAEKETSINWARDETRAHVDTESTALMSSLLLHQSFKVESLRVSDEDRFGSRVQPNEYESGCVTGVTGTVDIGVLKILSTARDSKRHSKVISQAVRENDPRNGESR